MRRKIRLYTLSVEPDVCLSFLKTSLKNELQCKAEKLEKESLTVGNLVQQKCLPHKHVIRYNCIFLKSQIIMKALPVVLLILARLSFLSNFRFALNILYIFFIYIYIKCHSALK